MYFNDQENRASIDSELLVNNAVLLRKPVDAVVTLPHPTEQEMIIMIHENSGAKEYRGQTCGWHYRWHICGETSGHAASRLIHGGQVDRGGGEIITKE